MAGDEGTTTGQARVSMALLWEPSDFNRRFVRATLNGLGFDPVVAVDDAESLVANVRQPAVGLAIVDPACEGALDALAQLVEGAPHIRTIAFGHDKACLERARALGTTSVMKRSIMQLDELIAAIDPSRATATRAADDGGQLEKLREVLTAQDATPASHAPEPTLAPKRFGFGSGGVIAAPAI
jgi:DNA-binding NarL/FixJ family response regulator